jgi:Flp pilus assembly protein TadD
MRRWLVLAVAAVAWGMGPIALADPSDDVSQALASDADFVVGKAAYDRKAWDEATKGMSRALVRHPDDADLHNYLGFAYRHLKQFDRAFEHYKRAIAIDPRHRGAHEYIGEAYLMVGDLASAERHLARLREICLLPCEELDDLDKAVVAYRIAKGMPAR